MCIGTPDWIVSRYAIDRNASTNDDTECKKIFCCAYREYDERKGITGGPGGVLHMQQKLMGSRVKAIRVQYIYRTADYAVPEKIEKEISLLNFKIRQVIAGAGFIASNEQIISSINRHDNPVLVCHDLGCAYGAYLLGLKYILVYHQQGGVLAEIESVGKSYSDDEAELITLIEKLVIDYAVKVYFPSNGAKEEFIKTSLLKLSDEEREILSDEPLYNTIIEQNVFLSETAILSKLEISIDEEEVFISVGDFNKDKGMDLVPEFLNEYQEKSRKRIAWIAVGDGGNVQIRAAIEEKCNNYGIKHYLIPHRIPHDELLTLLDKSKYFIMLHRKSIFDLAILEAMYHRKIIILSDCMANNEFNVLNNVIIVHGDYKKAADEVLTLKPEEISYKNRLAFSKFFGNAAFAARYAKAVKHLLHEQGMYQNYHSKVNLKFLSEWKDKYDGGKCVICGAGQSLDYLKIQDEDTVYIALNKAVFYPDIHFDMLFMQDEPKNQQWVLEDYNAYDCVKFYGIITNKHIPLCGLGDETTKYDNVKNKIVRYELAPNTYDYRTDEMFGDCGCDYICDAQSVLFSALQMAVYMGFSRIELCGIEFSNTNYGGTVNHSVYAMHVYENLMAAMEELKRKYPKTELNFMYTTNEKLLEMKYEQSYDEIIVSSIYTGNYRKLVELQKKSCCDGYRFDFTYITDEAWNSAKGNSEFAFFGGNTIKVEAVIEKIKQYWGKLLLFTDADLIFFRETKARILYELEDYDILFLRERRDGENCYGRAVSNINIGFVAMRCNESVLKFWEKAYEKTRTEGGWDQEIINNMLEQDKSIVKWKLFSEQFLNGGSINIDNISSQRICTACGSISQRNKLTKNEFLKKALENYQNQSWFE